MSPTAPSRVSNFAACSKRLWGVLETAQQNGKKRRLAAQTVASLAVSKL